MKYGLCPSSDSASKGHPFHEWEIDYDDRRKEYWSVECLYCGTFMPLNRWEAEERLNQAEAMEHLLLKYREREVDEYGYTETVAEIDSVL